jgi:glutamate/tyrosine decarboxylase-like PLP-dependent enzyme
MKPSDLAVLGMAADHATAYREATAVATHTPVVDYRTMREAFAGPVPEEPGEAEAIIEELVRLATPGIRAQTGPRFFGWVIGNSHPTGVAADWLASAWGQNAANLTAAPAASAVEDVACGWLLDVLGLPADASVGVVTGATVANFVCLAAARSEVLRRAGWNVEADGLFGAPPITVLIGADAHTTVYSGLKYLGLGAKRVVTVACDPLGRILPDAFAAALDAATGPVIAITQAGQINTGGCDPFDAIVPMAHAKGAWVHVDGAFGLWAQAAPARSHLTVGVDRADSWATDGHKWLQTPYDCGFAIVRDAEAHRRAMAVSASYLPPAEGGDRDPSTYVPELSRRARGFSVWAMIKALGRSGIAEMVERDCTIAAHIGETLAREPGIALVAPVTLNQFMVRFGDDDTLTRATIEQVQRDAIAFLGGADWRGRWVMRGSVCSIATTMAEADTSIAAIIDAWRAVQAR